MNEYNKKALLNMSLEKKITEEWKKGNYVSCGMFSNKVWCPHCLGTGKQSKTYRHRNETPQNIISTCSSCKGHGVFKR